MPAKIVLDVASAQLLKYPQSYNQHFALTCPRHSHLRRMKQRKRKRGCSEVAFPWGGERGLGGDTSSRDGRRPSPQSVSKPPSPSRQSGEHAALSLFRVQRSSFGARSFPSLPPRGCTGASGMVRLKSGPVRCEEELVKCELGPVEAERDAVRGEPEPVNPEAALVRSQFAPVKCESEPVRRDFGYGLFDQVAPLLAL
jgi:hypothetical protein